MLSNIDIQPYINKLADEVATAIDDRNIVEAFRNVPRHLFVQDGFYVRDKQTHMMNFKTLSDTEPSDWLEIIYENQVLLLSLGKTGPPSSSSEPVLMAQMLDALDISSGMNILEIGTGSGYNAALLAHLVGKTGKITSIDIQPKLVQDAKEAIDNLTDTEVSVHVGNGLLGVPENAPYDRIIATASHNRVPNAWIEQLEDDGSLLMSFGTTGGLLLLKKQGSSASGHFLKQRGYFMSLVEPSDNSETVINIADFDSLLSADFRFFAGWLIPDVAVFPIELASEKRFSEERGLRFRNRDGTESVIMKADNDKVKLVKQGSEEFAQIILDVVQRWDAFEQPDSSRFSFIVDSTNEQIIKIDDKNLIQL